MKNYAFHWLDGTTEIVAGSSVSDAFGRAGYGSGALPALDYYEEFPTLEELRATSVLIEDIEEAVR